MKKYISQKEMKKAAKTALAMVLAGTFSFSPSLAYASENNAENNNLETAELSSGTTSEVEDNNLVVTSNVGTTETEIPALVPGDFFYFAKLTIEKIKLILTMDDVKEAELLAQFASKRLEEAEALFAQGEEKLAIETIEKALEDMKIADTVVEGEKAEVVEAPTDTTEKEDSEVTETETNTDAEGEEATETQLPSTEAPTNTENDSTDATDIKTDDEEAIEEIEKLLSQNIIALTAAMEKVQNPVAKAKLKRNIEKSYAKLEKKLAKIEARLAKVAEEEESATIAPVEDELENEVEVNVESESDTQTVEEDSTTLTVPSKKEKMEVKKERKAVKEEAKTVKHESKKEKKEWNKKDRHDKAQKERKDKDHNGNGKDNH